MNEFSAFGTYDLPSENKKDKLDTVFSLISATGKVKMEWTNSMWIQQNSSISPEIWWCSDQSSAKYAL